MFFLSPLLLWFLAASSVPVIIHLINRRRHKTIQWAAMQFLLKAARQSRGKKKLRHLLILTCRALAIAALATAAARPFVSGLIGWGGGSIDTVVLLLDRSPSMEIRTADGQPTRRQQILEKVRDSMAQLGSARLVLIDSASSTPQEVPDPGTLDKLSSTAATDMPADFPNLLTKATDYLAESSGRSEIWLASDLQSSNWQPDDERWAAARARLADLPHKPALRVLSLTGQTATNASLRILGTRRNGNDLLVDLEILRSADARGTASIPLLTHLNGTSTSETLTVPGQSLRFQKHIPLPPDNDHGHGWLSIPADGNPRDNAAFFAYGPARATKSLIVATAGEAADYLTLAAAPPGFGQMSALRIDPTQAANHIDPDLSAILWAAPLPTGPTAESIHNFLSKGGQVLFLPPTTPSDLAFYDLKWSPPSLAPNGKFFILKDWNHDDGPLRNGLNGTPLSANRLKAIRRQMPIGDTTPLARWEDGEPFITRRIFDHGTAWFLGSIPDYAWSNLGDADVLLPAVQRIIQSGSERFDASYLNTVGATSTRLLAGESRKRLDDYGTPDPSNAEFEAGIFQLGDRLLALNRPLDEDSPEILSREKLDAALDGTGYTLLDQTANSNDPSLTRDVWRAFLVAVLLFFLSEALLCLPNKTSVEVIPQKATS